jgi:hemerythrin
MSLINWDPSLSVGVAEIDKQHQKLIGMINDLNDAMKQGKGKEALRQIVDELMSYTVTHFRAEEKYFTQFGYPEAEAHKNEHAAFVNKVADFREKFMKGNLGLTVEIMNFLRDWLKRHIQGTDKRYGPFFNAHGLK